MVEVMTETGNAIAGEDAEDISLVYGKFWWMLDGLGKNGKRNVPGGASLQNLSRSGRRKAWTPVRLRWVNFWHLLSNIKML